MKFVFFSNAFLCIPESPIEILQNKQYHKSFKSIKATNQTSCWNECEFDSMCYTISYFDGKQLDFNCFFFTAKEHERSSSKNFVSITCKFQYPIVFINSILSSIF